MNTKRALIVTVVVIIVLLAALMYVRAYNERFHVTEDRTTGLTVGYQLQESEFPNSESRLWVYGNANEDDRIDDEDLDYLKGVVAMENPSTTLSDANCDGEVDWDDVEYLQRILDSDEMDVYYIDNYYRVAEVSWPVSSIAIGYCSGAYVADLTGLTDKVVMVDSTIQQYWYVMDDDYSTLPTYGTTESPNYEAIIAAGVDVYVVGYCDANADQRSPSSLNPAGVDVMFVSTADNSGVDIPNESIDRSILMFAFLLQGDMEKTYSYLEWHDDLFDLMIQATSAIADEDKEAMIMARSWRDNSHGSYSITGKDNTNNIHAEWVGVYAVGQNDSQFLPNNYNNLSEEDILTLIQRHSRDGVIYYVDNEHDGMRGQYDLEECLRADAEMLSSSPVQIHYMGMAREMGNSPLYVVEAAFYVCVMYPEIAQQIGLDYRELFTEYFQKFASSDYWQGLDIEDFFLDYGVA